MVKTPITTNGKYIVKVEGEGYTSTANEYIVRCKKLDCKTCKPSFVVPLITVPNNEDQVKIILSWTGPSNALIAKSQVVDSSIAMEQCYSTSQNKSTCYSTKSTYEDNYFELEEFSKLLDGKAGTVLVKLSDAWIAPSQIQDQHARLPGGGLLATFLHFYGWRNIQALWRTCLLQQGFFRYLLGTILCKRILIFHQSFINPTI